MSTSFQIDEEQTAKSSLVDPQDSQDSRSWKIGGRNNSEGVRKALVDKNGSYRLRNKGLLVHKKRFLTDSYVTLIDLPWRYGFAIICSVFLSSFILFGAMWWLVGHSHGDFDNLDNDDHVPCVQGIRGFAHSLLFSMETQTTIGYGAVYPNSECVGSIVLLYIQVIIGFLLETIMLGFIFVKVAHPKNRAQTLLFSRRAVVCMEDGQLCLQVRVGDLRKSHLLDSNITAMLVQSYTTAEGAFYPLYQRKIKFESQGMEDQIILLWPTILTHRITPESPLYDIKPADLMEKDFELILFLTGTMEASGEVCQARASYSSRDILWGHRFESIEEYDSLHGHWHVNFANFENVVQVQKIPWSALDLAARVKEDKLSNALSDALPANSKTKEEEP